MKLNIAASCRLRDKQLLFNGMPLCDEAAQRGLAAIYRSLKIDYPKFFKMDRLSKAGFLAAELLLGAPLPTPSAPEERAIVLISRSGSLLTDCGYQQTITADNFFPSPALFVYTLANIVAGEVAIRHQIHGETAMYISEAFDASELHQRVTETFHDTSAQSILCGWIESDQETDDLLMLLVRRDEQPSHPFTTEQIRQLYIP